VKKENFLDESGVSGKRRNGVKGKREYPERGVPERNGNSRVKRIDDKKKRICGEHTEGHRGWIIHHRKVDQKKNGSNNAGSDFSK